MRSVEEIFRPMKEACTQAAVTNETQISDIIRWALKQTGRAEVYQSSFSISEEYIRRMIRIKEEGLITGYHLLLDHKATLKTARLAKLIEHVAEETRLGSNHSKVVLIKPQEGERVVVISSQNLTRGNRTECYIVTKDEEVTESVEADLQRAFHEGSIDIKALWN